MHDMCLGSTLQSAYDSPYCIAQLSACKSKKEVAKGLAPFQLGIAEVGVGSFVVACQA
jgi:hypothetical protein